LICHNPNVYLWQWEVCVFNVLADCWWYIRVCPTYDSCGFVGMDLQVPELHFSEAGVKSFEQIGLVAGDEVEKPVCTSMFGQVMDAIGVEELPMERVAVIVFGSCEVSQVDV